MPYTQFLVASYEIEIVSHLNSIKNVKTVHIKNLIKMLFVLLLYNNLFLFLFSTLHMFMLIFITFRAGSYEHSKF